LAESPQPAINTPLNATKLNVILFFIWAGD
jgi:hypothetical protein